MAKSAPRISKICGIPNSYRDWKPYHDLNEVLNKIGVMAKRSELPFANMAYPTKKKIYDYRSIDGMAYIVPKDWRSCLYEDLETGEYYIISPHPENEKNDPKVQYSWIAFKLSGLTDGITHYGVDETGKRVKQILKHTGSFIDLMWRCSLTEILDTLAKTQKPIVIKVIRYLYYYIDSYPHEKGAICQFDI